MTKPDLSEGGRGLGVVRTAASRFAGIESAGSTDGAHRAENRSEASEDHEGFTMFDP